MNREAQRLGLKNTHFVNATGLPDPQHYTTARDLGLLAAALIRDFPEHYPTSIRIKEYTYNRISQPNRNRLLWLDPTVDGVKTGHTESAGYCLVASAKRGPRRLCRWCWAPLGRRARPGIAEAAQLGLPVLRRGQAVRQGPGGVELKVWKGAHEVKAGFLERLHAVPAQGHGREAQGQPGQQPAAAGAGAEGPAHRTCSCASTTSPSANTPWWRWKPCRWPASSAGPGTRCVCGSSDDRYISNGQFMPIAEAKVSAMDRGFLFGDGAYEVIPVYSRRPFRLAEHLARLERRRSTASASPIRSARRSGHG
jgi:hypothetical protein